MITKGNRTGGRPVLLKNSIATLLERIPLNEKTFSEECLQKLIHENPSILPIKDIESGFSPLISIGREVQTSAGFIDNLFISPEGYLTIVETKLWRNPQARREVVGQIIDYAKELNSWSFSDLNNTVKKFNRFFNNKSDGLIETIRKYKEFDEYEEQFFIDNVSKNLKRGRFLLLIVGDGIRESVEEMIEYLSKHPQLYFTLALIELQLYNIEEDNSIIIIPQVVTRTKEITRAIFRIEGNQSSEVKVNIETDLGTEINKREAIGDPRLTITAQDFFDQLEKNTDKAIVEFANQIIKDCEEMGLFIEWNTSSFSVKLPDPLGSGIKIGVFTVDKWGYVYLGFSRGQFEKLEIPLEISYSFSADTAIMLPGIKQHGDQKYRWDRYATVDELRPVHNEFIGRVKKYTQEILTALENRVAANM